MIETPQALTVITNDRLTALNVRSIADAVRYTAGVTDYGSRDDPRGYGGYIRGFFPDTYLDGLRLPLAANSQSFDLEPYGLERIEILRGANSALYGSGQLGGVINAVSKTPRLGQVNEVAIQGGSFGRIQGMADIGGSLDSDGTLLWRLNTLLRNSGTQFDNIRNDRIYVAPSIRWAPTDDTAITMRASYTQIEGGSSSQFLPAVGTVLYNPRGTVARDFLNSDRDFDVYSKRQASVGYELEHRLASNWTVRQNLRFAHTDLAYRYVTAVAFLADNRTLTRQALLQSSNYNNLSLDNQSEITFRTGPVTHDVLVGLDYSNQFVGLRRGQGPAPSLDVFNPVYRPITSPVYASNTNTNQIQNQGGIYAQDQIGLGNWRLTLTGRGAAVSSDLTNNNTHMTSSSSSTAFIYRGALLYASPTGLSPYVAYSTGFQPQTGTDRLNNPFVPQTGNQVEIGIKYQPPTTNILFSLAAYDLTQNNVQTPDPVNTGFSAQTGQIRTKGVEFETIGSLTPALNVIVSATYQEQEITRSNTAREIGSRPVAIPSHMASAYLQRNFSLSDQVSGAIGGGVRYNGNTAGDLPNTFVVPSQVLFDVNGHIDFERWRLQMNGTNITDRTIIAACTRSVACSYGTGRAVYATLSYRW